MSTSATLPRAAAARWPAGLWCLLLAARSAAGPSPPVVVSVQAECGQGRVMVEFSRAMDPLTAANPGAYMVESLVQGEPLPVRGAQLQPPGAMVLLLVEGLVPGPPYLLRIEGVRDAMGVPVAPGTAVPFQCRPPLVIEVQPRDAEVCEGSPATFSVAASGASPLRFDWLRDGRPDTNGTVVSTATDSRLTVPSPLAPDDGAAFSVRVSGGGTAVVSEVALLRVHRPPILRVEPQDRSAARGGGVTFEVVADSQLPATFAWSFEGVPLRNGGRVSGADRAVLVISELEPGDGGRYEVTVGNNCGRSTTAAALLTVVEPPVFVQHPVSVVSPFQAQVTFTAFATHSPTYQWYRNGVAIPGATGSTLVRPDVQRPDVGVYHVEAANAAGTASSGPAHLQILLTRLGLVRPGEMATDNLEDLGGAAPAALASPGPGGGAPPTLVFHGVPLLFTTAAATRQAWETAHCGIPAGHPMWLLYHSSRQETLGISTEGSDFDTVLAVCAWDGDPGHPPTELAPCDDNGGHDGRTSALRFSFEARKDYYLVVDGVGGATGTVRLQVGDTLLRNHRADPGTGAFRVELVGPTWATTTLRTAIDPSTAWAAWAVLHSVGPTNRDWVLSYVNDQARQDGHRNYGAQVEP